MENCNEDQLQECDRLADVEVYVSIFLDLLFLLSSEKYDKAKIYSSQYHKSNTNDSVEGEDC